ncbi:hypothetical protein WA158_002401 [Blastocystis sp. Blastoise]
MIFLILNNDAYTTKRMRFAVDCTSNQVKLTIERRYGDNSEEESLTIFNPEHPSGNGVFTDPCCIASRSNTIVVSEVCTVAGQHTITLYDSNHDGWGSATTWSGVLIYINGVLIFDNTIPYSTEEVGDQTTTFMVHSYYNFGSTWKYSDSIDSSIINTWYKTVPTTWTSASTTTSLPIRSSITRYFITGYTIDSTLLNINTITVSLKTKSGYVLYVNGQEIVRHKMPTGSITGSTAATSAMDTNDIIKTVSIPHYVFQDTLALVVAVEVHQQSVSDNDNTFDMAITYINSNTNEGCAPSKFYSGSYTCNMADAEGSVCSYIADHIHTTIYTSNQQSSLIYTYTFPDGSYEFINQYMLRNSNIADNKHTWNIYGQKDDNQWIIISKKIQINWEQTNQIFKYNVNENRYVFKAIRLEITAQTTTNIISFTEFQVYSCSLPVLDTSLQYPSSSVTIEAGPFDVTITPTTDAYSTFTCTPSLPEGLILNENTGVITGYTSIVGTNVYTIRAVSISGYTSEFLLTINVLTCSPPSFLPIQITRISSTSAIYEQIDVYNELDVLIYRYSPSAEKGTFNTNLCIPTGTLRVVLSSTTGNGWYKTALMRFSLFLNNEPYIISTLSLMSGYSQTYLLNTNMYIPYGDMNWKYIQGSVPLDWYKPTFTSSNTWSSFDMNNKQNNVATSPLQLYRNEFSIADMNNYQGFEMKLRVRAGFILYVNGNELYRQFIEGDLNGSSSTTGGSVSTKWFTVSGPITSLHIGTNTIAIGILNNLNSNPSIIDFDCYLLPLLLSSITNRLEGATLTPSDTSYLAVENLFDNRLTTSWSVSVTPFRPVAITIALPENRAEYINKYCIYNGASSPSGDPSDWHLDASNDGSEYTTISTVTNTYYDSKYTAKCIYISNPKPWRYFKFNVTELAIKEQIRYFYSYSELLFTNEKIDYTSIPTFSVDPSFIQAYTNFAIPSIQVSSLFYNNFELHPSLPSPLEFDSSSCSIYGTYNGVIPRSQYTLTASTLQGQSVSTNIDIEIQRCLPPKVGINVLLYGDVYAIQQGLLIKHIDGTIILIVPVNTLQRASNNYYSFCIDRGLYNVSLFDSGGNSWNEGFVYIYTEYNEDIYRGTLYNYNKGFNSVLLPLGSEISSQISEWDYNQDVHSIPSNWIQTSYDSSFWPKSIPLLLPVTGSTTQYYRYLFTINTFENTNGYELNIYTEGGYIAYINGKEILRSNLPEGNKIGIETFAISNNTHPIATGISESYLKNTLIIGTNIICVEVHKGDVSTQGASFDASLFLLYNGIFRQHEGSIDGDILYEGTELDKLFDDDMSSTFISGPRCTNAWYSFTYKNRKEYINSYSIVTGPNCNSRHPTSWKLEGSNDNKNWILLHRVDNTVFTQYMQTNSYTFYNIESYTSYKYTALACDGKSLEEDNLGGEDTSNCNYSESTTNKGFQLNGIVLSSRMMVVSCQEQNGYIAGINNEYSYKSCPSYYEGRIQAKCINGKYQSDESFCVVSKPIGMAYNSPNIIVTKGIEFETIPQVQAAEYICSFKDISTIPEGISIDTNTGKIYGKTTSVFEQYENTVICQNTRGSTSVDIVIKSISNPNDLIWVYIVIAVIIIAIIAIVIICIMKRRSSKKNHTAIKSTTTIKNSKQEPTKTTKI